jgi:hypothetical protein
MAFEDVDLTDFWNPVICERVTGLTLSIKFQSLAEPHFENGYLAYSRVKKRQSSNATKP